MRVCVCGRKRERGFVYVAGLVMGGEDVWDVSVCYVVKLSAGRF